MSRMQRIRSILVGLLTILCAVILYAMQEEGYMIVAVMVSVSLLLRGVKYMVYYFTMARHMVGGKSILFRGIIALDLAIFILTLTEVPPAYIMLYLMAIHMISGILGVMHALEEKRLGSRHWRLNLAEGAGNILLAVICLFSLNSTAMLVTVYSLGLFYTGCLHIASAFRKTAIAYIP